MRFPQPFRIALLLIVGLSVARPVAAEEGLLRWLERLSGPGPYFGIGASVPAVCFGVRKDNENAPDPDPREDRPIEPFWSPGCGEAARNRLRATLRFEVAWLGASGNNLQYAAPVTSEELETSAFVFLPSVDFGVLPWLELGAGIGVIRFSGDLFDSFTKPAIQPVRVTLKPLLLSNHPNRYGLEFLQLRYTSTMIPGGFKAEDFGAIPGTFSTGTEFLSDLSLVVDAWALYRLIRPAQAP